MSDAREGAKRRATDDLLEVIDKLTGEFMNRSGPPDMALLPYVSALSEAAVCIRTLAAGYSKRTPGAEEGRDELVEDLNRRAAACQALLPGADSQRPERLEGKIAAYFHAAELASLSAHPAGESAGVAEALEKHVRSEAEHFRSEIARKNLTTYGKGAADAIFAMERMLADRASQPSAGEVGS